MKKISNPWTIISILCFLFSGSIAGGTEPIEQLLASRTAVVWIEGQRLGDMIVGARARMDFVLVDRTLTDAVYNENSSAPDWLRLHAQYAGSDAVKGKTLFIVRFKALIPWTFDPEEMTVGTSKVTWKDILTRKEFFPTGDLPSGMMGELAFSVPAAAVTTSHEISVGYGTWQASLRIPGR